MEGNQLSHLRNGVHIYSSLEGAISEAEEAINSHIPPDKKMIRTYESQLKQYLIETDALRSTRILGLAALGNLRRHGPTENEELGDFSDITIEGVEVHKITPNKGEKVMKHKPDRYSFYLHFTDRKAFPDTASASKPQSYFIRPSNILSMYDATGGTDADLRQMLKVKADICYKELSHFHELTLQQKIYKLDYLAESAGNQFMGRFAGHAVSIDTPIYYVVERDETGAWPKKYVLPPGETLPQHRYPYGQVTTCSFIEQVVPSPFSDLNLWYKDLELNEPCIVLNDDTDLPYYLVPISQIRDVLMMED